MKLTIVLLTASFLSVYASGTAQRVTLSGNKLSLKEVFATVQAQTGYDVFYTEHIVKVSKPISISANDIPLEKFLDMALLGQPFGYKIAGKTVLLSLKETAPVASDMRPESMFLPITGHVIDADGKPLAGATIRVKGKAVSTVTDEKGAFVLIVNESDVLIVSYVGFSAREYKVNDAKDIIISLMKLETTMSEVTVNTGYQALSKERVTGSFNVITEEQLKDKIQPDILSRLKGLSAGLTFFREQLKIRGTSTLNTNSAIARPLIVVDGFPYEGPLDAINPVEVANITILKDAAAASIYGARSANGVIVITTRSGKGKTQLEYAGRVVVTPWKDNREYRNTMNSAESVDFLKEMFGLFHTAYGSVNKRLFVDEVWQLMYDRENGIINSTELEQKLNIYRNRDNYDDIKERFLRTAISQQHNVSMRGGAGKYTYAASINYAYNPAYVQKVNNNRIGYNIKSSFQFFDWMRADFAILGSSSNAEDNAESSGFSPAGLLQSGPSYRVLFDESGNELKWYPNKSQQEINRLLSLGLLDETFYPLRERGMRNINNKAYYNNINAGLNFKLFNGFTADLKYQTEKSFSHAEGYFSEYSYYIRNMVNNGTKITNGVITNLFPTGGMIDDTWQNTNSYTLRAQLNYNRIFSGVHNMIAIAGAERRGVHSTSSAQRRFGYDRLSLGRKFIDEATLSKPQSGTESPDGNFNFPNGGNVAFTDNEDRFVAFYANASYTYNSRYAISGSIRMDQSNLFGTDPKFQYKPLWSAGVKWNLHSENFMRQATWLNTLVMRITKGINGNINKDAGPYTIMSTTSLNTFTNEYGGAITRPPNSGLRWERTNQTNMGIDFSILNNRIGGTIEYYQKNTSDLLGGQEVDPTSGWSSLTFNYASMYNRGYEITLNTAIVKKRNLQWNATAILSYNKNKVTKLVTANRTVSSYLTGTNIREGMPMGTLFSVRWAGLDEQGAPQAFKKDGTTIVKQSTALEVADLVEEGTSIAPYSASMINNISYKGFRFSCLFIGYAGYILRDAIPAYLSGEQLRAYNLDRNVANYWKTVQDSKDPGKSPAWARTVSSNVSNLWYAADKHIKKANYVKLQEVTLAYSLPSGLLKRGTFSDITINMQVQNIWFTGAQGRRLNPEAWQGTSLTGTDRGFLAPTVYTFGLSLKF